MRRVGEMNDSSQGFIMDKQRLTVSLTLIVLICFFLPWIQVSCGGSEERVSGVDLARDNHHGLWLIPILMVVVLIFNLARNWKERREVSALTTLIAGLVTAYFMNRERARADNSSGLIAVTLTGWFWLGFGSTIALVAVSVFRLLRRRTP